MDFKRSLRKFFRVLRGLRNVGCLKYRVISAGELIRAEYQNSTGYFFDDAIVDKGKKPQGIYFIGGGDNLIEVDYEIGIIDKPQIEVFIKSFGITFELIYWSEEK